MTIGMVCQRPQNLELLEVSGGKEDTLVIQIGEVYGFHEGFLHTQDAIICLQVAVCKPQTHKGGHHQRCTAELRRTLRPPDV
jgi:hypothetical protein